MSSREGGGAEDGTTERRNERDPVRHEIEERSERVMNDGGYVVVSITSESQHN